MVTLWPSGCGAQDVRSVRPAERAASEAKMGHTKRRVGEVGRAGGFLQKVTLFCMQHTPSRQATFRASKIALVTRVVLWCKEL